MKFTDYKYERPNIEMVLLEFKKLIEGFEKSQSSEEQDKIIIKINTLRNEVESMIELVNIRNSINTEDSLYEKEKAFMDENIPIYEGIIAKYYKVLVNSKFKNELEDKWGKQLFILAEMKLKTFEDGILEELKEENKLITEYEKLKASARIVFEGEERNLAQLEPFIQSKYREMRKRAYEASTNFYAENEEKFDNIFDKLVKVRHKIAKKLGYNNFVELAYVRMMRSDYDSNMVKKI